MTYITINKLRAMRDIEGLIIQGCGGELLEWVNGIKQLLTEQGIIQNNISFEEVYAFKHNGLTNLLFRIDNVELDIGRLAVWRLQTHQYFRGTWLSDYLCNSFGDSCNL